MRGCRSGQTGQVEVCEEPNASRLSAWWLSACASSNLVPRIHDKTIKMRRTGPTNQDLRSLIQTLKKESIDRNVKIWKRIASDLEKPTRIRRVVNLARINRFTKEGEIIVVPGKVLGAGMIGHKVDVAAYSFSGSARQQIEKLNGKCLSIWDLLKTNPKGEKVRIIG